MIFAILYDQRIESNYFYHFLLFTFEFDCMNGDWTATGPRGWSSGLEVNCANGWPTSHFVEDGRMYTQIILGVCFWFQCVKKKAW